MSPKGQPQLAPVVVSDSAMVLGDVQMSEGLVFAPHVHDHHQIVWAAVGVLTVRIDDRQWILPPTRALWIPSGVAHQTGNLRGAEMRAIFVDTASRRTFLRSPTLVSVSPLLHLLFDHLTYVAGHDADARRRAEAVVFDLLEPLEIAGLTLRWPRDPAAREIASALSRNPGDGRPLPTHAADVGRSARTVARAFASETGITFGRWRTHVRLAAALTLLAEGTAVNRVSERVGYATPSAFVAAFRRELGVSPGEYFSTAR